jgi:hypothetical protein
MPESAYTRLVTEHNLHEALSDWSGSLFIDITKAPFNVVFDAPIWTPEIIAQNTIGLRAAVKVPGFSNAPAGFCKFNGDVEVEALHFLNGRGRAATVFQLADGLPWDTRGFIIPVRTHDAGLRHLTVDGSQPTRVMTGGSGGVYGSNISVMNSDHIYLEHVRSVRAVQHCFDITTPIYGNAGDGAIIPDPSEFVYLDHCYGELSGDDAFSTHGSGKVRFNNCHAKDTWKKNLYSYTNSNGFEIDDYSYDVTLTNCHAEGFAHGFEIKAHATMSAGRNVRLIGCTAERNEVNLSARHIGKHINGQPFSLTADNLQIIGFTSRHPRQVFFGGVNTPDGDEWDDQTPPGDQYHHVVIGAYDGVTITSLHCISDPNYNYAGSSAILIHFRAKNVRIDGYRIEGHTTGTWDIHCTGGDQPAENVTILNGTHKDSAPGGISCGSYSNATLQHIRNSRNVAGSPNKTAFRAYGNKTIRDCKVDPSYPFQTNFNISDNYYSNYETPMATNVAYAGGHVPLV